ncbi:hypothetical protein [Sodalis-like endosymbiont of Proechinophthirus fluctus]|nr:hypothetical protein [Sodalis-like endosymbiont of Proechinophthirus fluctus]
MKKRPEQQAGAILVFFTQVIIRRKYFVQSSARIVAKTGLPGSGL